MKTLKIYLFFFVLCIAIDARGQWSSSGNNIYNTNSGNVGVGTSTPAAQLEVKNQILVKGAPSFGLASAFLSLDGGYTGYLGASNIMGILNTGITLAANGNTPLNFATNGSDRIIVLGDGKVGIGTITPAESLHLNGSIRGHISGALRISSGSGYLDVGAQNTSWAHFETDRPRFYFNTGLAVNSGLIGSYDEDLNLQTSGTTRLTITNSSGDVGIGTSAPSNLQGWSKVLDVRGANHSKILATTSSAAYRAGIYAHDSWTGGGGFVGTESNHNLHFITNYDPKMSILTDGNVGIGVVSPAKKLDVNGIIGISGVSVVNTNNSANDIYINSRVLRNESTVNQDGMYINYNSTGGSSAHLRFYASGTTQRMHLDASNGRVGIGTSAPTDLLDVNGTVRIRSLDPNNNATRVLVSDTNGKLFWKEIAVAYPLANTFVGQGAGNGNTTGTYNVYVGSSSGLSVNGNKNTFIGTFTGFDTFNTGNENVLIGYETGYNNTTGSNNVFVGTYAGWENYSGHYNISLGYNSGPSSSNLSNTIAIGPFASVSVNNGVVLGGGGSLVGIRQNSPTYALHVQNAYCDGSTWYNASDKNLKRNFRSIQNESTLDKLMRLKIERWTYKADSTNADHIGPTAQEFNEVFNLGSNKTAISTVDEIGIALVAIQELNKKTENLEELIVTQNTLLANVMNTLADNVTSQSNQNDAGLQLYQNSPNPFRNDTEIQMFIPGQTKSAMLFIYDVNGKQIDKKTIVDRGHVKHTLRGSSLTAGLYIYTLLADDKCAGVKRMILTD